ncbi:MAG: SRPBCC domain-containing protein [Roseiflexaceae bacterium]|nr:SRPBCC domain-containing protein [Roseiflexaceae bacterium]
MDQDIIFKALADTSRRTLLDLLFQHDGRSLVELQAHLPMTRFGTMKHLQVLEDAKLITTRKVGREKLHYLNAVPIQMVYDRWVSKYAQPWARTLVDLKYSLEDEMAERPTRVFEIFIRTTPAQLWQALIDGALTQQYYMGTRVESTWTPGAKYRYLTPDGGVLLQGQVLEINPPHRLVTTFQPTWNIEAYAQPSKVIWEITQVGSACRVTVTHEGLDPTSALTPQLSTGWAQILSGLKTLLETGAPLVIERTTEGNA